MLPLALDTSLSIPALHILRFLRKEVIQPQVLLRLPCYDFTPVICPALDGSFPKVRPPALGIADSHGVTGGPFFSGDLSPGAAHVFGAQSKREKAL